MTATVYSLVLFAHILAAMLLVGASLFAPLVHRAIRSAGSMPELRTWLDIGRRSAQANPVAAIVLLATGVWLAKDVWWGEAWFWVAVGAWLVNSTLAGAVVRRAATAVADAASHARGEAVTEEVDRLRRSRAWALAETVIGANDVAILYVMIDKPALGPSLAILALANAAVLAAKVVPELLLRRPSEISWAPRDSGMAPTKASR